MAGNSQRRGEGHKSKSSAVGSGGRGRKALKGRGPTPKAEDRVYHKAYKAKQEKLARAAAANRRIDSRRGRARSGLSVVILCSRPYMLVFQYALLTLPRELSMTLG